MPTERSCVRCGKPILEPRRRKYCGDACADSAARLLASQREEHTPPWARRGASWRRLFRYYPRAEP
jgi:hypothetical protein